MRRASTNVKIAPSSRRNGQSRGVVYHEPIAYIGEDGHPEAFCPSCGWGVRATRTVRVHLAFLRAYAERLAALIFVFFGLAITYGIGYAFLGLGLTFIGYDVLDWLLTVAQQIAHDRRPRPRRR